ncbi:baeRF2 domain-containing protein [Streptomyces albogriseolus]|uniref:baeRF2 domain-containing protein n=1 Tax=Streptomyces albogriseolus TaxID=1887 RepID=UPI0037028087
MAPQLPQPGARSAPALGERAAAGSRCAPSPARSPTSCGTRTDGARDRDGVSRWTAPPADQRPAAGQVAGSLPRGAAGPRPAGQVEGERDSVHRTASSDWSERHFQLKVENTWEHNAGEIAEALNAAYEESGADLVVLAGDPRERPAVHEKLSEAVRRVTTETKHGGRAAGTASPALEEAIEQARRQHTRHRVEEALDRFRAGRVGADRPTEAVEGAPALVEAAREHRIDTLLVRPDGPELDRETWVGARPDQVAARRSDARTLGESDPTAVRADDALLRAAAVTAADVLVVPPADEDGASATDIPTGGLGALLRWTYDTAPA